MCTRFVLVAGLATLIATSVGAADGVGSSGGGVVEVCRKQGRIEYVQLLDLHESRTRYGGLTTTTNTLEGDYLKAVQRTYALQGAGPRTCMGKPCYNEADVRENLRKFFDRVDFLPSNEQLPWLGDTGNMIQPVNIPGCGYEQLAIFHDDTGRISIDSQLWRAMNPQNQAALVVHELYYRYERDLSESTSESTRAIVALIFAPEHAVTPVFSSIPAQRMICGTFSNEPGSRFSVYPSFAENGERTGLNLQFSHIMGRPLVARTVARFAGMDNWNVGRGDPEHREAIDDLLVWDKNANKVERVRLDGEQSFGWELELQYVYRNPIRLTLLKDGKAIQSATVDFCQSTK